MILFRIGFTKKTSAPHETVQELAIDYLNTLLLNGQAYGGLNYGWDEDEFVAVINMPTPNAARSQFDSKRGDHAYDEMMTVLRKKPVWTKIAWDRENEYATLDDAPHLYLYTSAHTIEPAINNGKTGTPIQTHTIPLNDSIRENLYYWSRDYSDHDDMWIKSGTLENAAYRELTHLGSELTKGGRELCQQIETATQVPTYYYFMRYYTQKIGKEKHRCPGCAQPWQHLPVIKTQPFHASYLKCESCRLVSHLGFS